MAHLDELVQQKRLSIEDRMCPMCEGSSYMLETPATRNIDAVQFSRVSMLVL